MLIKTNGIVLRNTKYAETSVISKIYTKKYGIQTFMINGVRSAKAAIKPSLLQPLTLLEIVMYYNQSKEIHRLKEAKTNPSLQLIHFETIRSTIGMYASELIYKSIKEEDPDENMYDFIERFILKLDSENAPLALMPIYLTVQLTKFLGFFPQNNFSKHTPFFNLADGAFEETADPVGRSLDLVESEYLSRILETDLENLQHLHVPKAVRVYLLSRLQEYYSIHLTAYQPLKSISVLSSIMSGI